MKSVLIGIAAPATPGTIRVSGAFRRVGTRFGGFGTVLGYLDGWS